MNWKRNTIEQSSLRRSAFVAMAIAIGVSFALADDEKEAKPAPTLPADSKPADKTSTDKKPAAKPAKPKAPPKLGKLPKYWESLNLTAKQKQDAMRITGEMDSQIQDLKNKLARTEMDREFRLRKLLTEEQISQLRKTEYQATHPPAPKHEAPREPLKLNTPKGAKPK